MPAPEQQQKAAEQPPEKARTTYEDVGPGYVAGNLTEDPTMRFTPEGRPLVKCRVAETPRVKNADTGEWEDGKPSFHDVIIWGDMAGRVVENLVRGDRVIAHGQWQRQWWQDDQGNERHKTVLTARDIGPSMLFRHVKVSRTDRKAGQQL